MALNDDVKLEALFDEIDSLAKQVRFVDSKISDYFYQGNKTAAPLLYTTVVLIFVASCLSDYYKGHEVVPCSSYYMPMLMNVFFVIGMVIFVHTLVRLVSSHNQERVWRKQMRDLRPHAILLKVKLELALAKKAATSMSSWQMMQITLAVDNTENNDKLYTNSMTHIVCSIMETVMFVMMMIFFGGLDSCTDAPTIAPLPTGGFA